MKKYNKINKEDTEWSVCRFCHEIITKTSKFCRYCGGKQET
jgi:RNA polymerase subunit RPABC4/transcription elongation factor Spt4